MRRIAVLDIGKTNAKVLVVDLATGAEEVLARTPNAVRRDGLYPHHDIEMLWAFALGGLRAAAARGVDAVSITTHGAAAVLVDDRGGRAQQDAVRRITNMTGRTLWRRSMTRSGRNFRRRGRRGCRAG